MVAKEPRPGACKTRLCPPLTPPEASSVYASFLTDLMAALQDFRGADRVAGIAYTPATAHAYFQQRAPELALVQQQGKDLGERLPAIARYFLNQGAGAVVVLSSDSPNLPRRWLHNAFVHLQDSDVVLGPCEDGGYYLVGMRRFIPEIFDSIAWSTEVVLEQTLERARSAGLKTALLPVWYDVDELSDLQRLTSDLLDRQHGAACPATAAILADLRRRGRLPVAANPVNTGEER